MLEKVLRSGAKVSQRNESSPTCDTAVERDAGKRMKLLIAWLVRNYGLRSLCRLVCEVVPSSLTLSMPYKSLLQTILYCIQILLEPVSLFC